MPDTVLIGSLTAADGTGGVSPPAGSVLEIGLQDHPAASLDIEGTFTGTVVIEASAEDTPAVDWFTPVVLNAALTAVSATLTAPGRRFMSAAGLARLRIRCTAFTSGPIPVTLRAGQGAIGAAGGGGGGGGAVTVADGADVALGTTTDAGIITDVNGTAIGFLRGLIKQSITLLARVPALVSGRVPVDPSGVTSPVSAASLPLPAGASTEATLAAQSAKLPSALISNRLDVNLGAAPAALTVGTLPALPTGANVIGAVTQSGTWNVTVNAALPTGANTIGAVTQASGPWTVQGAAAAGAAVSGNPVLQGVSDLTNAQTCRQIVNTTSMAPTGIPAVGLVAMDIGANTYTAVHNDGGGANASLRVNLASGGSSTSIGAAVDGDASAGLKTFSVGMSYNGTNADRNRNNTDVTLLASAARTTTQTSANITTYNCSSLTVWMNTTVFGTSSNTLSVVEVDPASGAVVTLLASAAIVSNVMTTLRIFPAATVTANVSANARIPRTIQIIVTVGNANPSTFSVGYDLQPA